MFIKNGNDNYDANESYKLVINSDEVTNPKHVIEIKNPNHILTCVLFYKNGKCKQINFSGHPSIRFSLGWFIKHQIEKATFHDENAFIAHMVSLDNRYQSLSLT